MNRKKKTISGKQIKVYNTLKSYLDYKELSLKTYFDKKINEARIVQLYKRALDTKVGKFFLIRAIDWLKKKFPKAVVGAIVFVAATAFNVFQIAEDMADNAVTEGKKQLINLVKKSMRLQKNRKRK